MNTSPSLEERLFVRIAPEQKALLTRAAQLTGRKVSDYIRAILLAGAEQTILQEQVLKLSARDSELFSDVMSRDAEPNESLRRAAKAHAERIVS